MWFFSGSSYVHIYLKGRPLGDFDLIAFARLFESDSVEINGETTKSQSFRLI